MRVVTGAGSVGAGSVDAGSPVAVLLDPRVLDGGIVAGLRPVLGGRVPPERLLHGVEQMRRPFVRTTEDHVVVGALVAADPAGRERLLLVVAGQVLVVVGSERAQGWARDALDHAHGPRDGLALVLAAAGHAAEEELGRLAETRINVDQLLGDETVLSVAVRRETNRQRASLFEWRQLYADLSRMADDEELLAEALGPDALRPLRLAQVSFGYSSSTADRLYALLGDVLAQQDALTSQRLTRVTTIFLPLTVSTGFFGMNFGWMVGAIGSLWSFLLLGVLLPVLAVLVSLLVGRRYGG